MGCVTRNVGEERILYCVPRKLLLQASQQADDGETIGARRVDFFVEGRISVELKAITQLEHVHLAQALNYLETYEIKTGLLINFGHTSLQFHRLNNKKFRSK